MTGPVTMPPLFEVIYFPTIPPNAKFGKQAVYRGRCLRPKKKKMRNCPYTGGVVYGPKSENEENTRISEALPTAQKAKIEKLPVYRGRCLRPKKRKLRNCSYTGGVVYGPNYENERNTRIPMIILERVSGNS